MVTDKEIHEMMDKMEKEGFEVNRSPESVEFWREWVSSFRSKMKKLLYGDERGDIQKGKHDATNP